MTVPLATKKKTNKEKPNCRFSPAEVITQHLYARNYYLCKNPNRSLSNINSTHEADPFVAELINPEHGKKFARKILRRARNITF